MAKKAPTFRLFSIAIKGQMTIGTIASSPRATLPASHADGVTCGDVEDSARISITVDRL